MNPPQKPANIQRFELAAAALLGRLYEAFPRPLHISSAQLEEEMIAANLVPQDYLWLPHPVRPWETHTGSTLIWLAEEGLVRYTSEQAQRFTGVVLTAKGYAALNAPLLPPSGAETNGQRILRFSKDTVTTGLSAAIAGIVQAVAS